MPELAVIRGEGLCRGNSVVLCFDRVESRGGGVVRCLQSVMHYPGVGV